MGCERGGCDMKRTPLPRKTPLAHARGRRIRLGRERMDPKLRAYIYQRSRGRCDLCAEHLNPNRWEAHHRRLRSQGGQDSPCNIIALHGASCHARVHGRPEWSYRHGFMVPSWADPADWPVFRHRQKWQQPTAQGWVGAQPGPGQGVAS